MRGVVLAAGLLAGTLTGQPIPALPAPPDGGVLPLPPRRASALAGSELLPRLDGRSVAEREALLYDEIAAGNVPAFLRRLVRVDTSATIGGRRHWASFWVTPDYLALGSDADSFRMPMTPRLAQQVCELLGCTLPTRRMVDAVWRRATVKLAPATFDPREVSIVSPRIFWRHHLRIRARRRESPAPLGALVGGIKKDVVVSARLAASPGRVVIYGWHRLDGAPIQPLSAVHVATYADYSHGVRLVQRGIVVDGEPTTVAAVLADPVLHPLLSDEGAFESSSYPVEPPPSSPRARDR